jgi:hypothetical protein
MDINDDYHSLPSTSEILVAGWPVPLAKVEGGCFRSSRANHFAGSNTDRKAGSVKGKSSADISLNASPVERLVIVVAYAAAVMATTFERR